MIECFHGNQKRRTMAYIARRSVKRPRRRRAPGRHEPPFTPEEWKAQAAIREAGILWTIQQRFWLFGTCSYTDGTRITDEQAHKDAAHFFNKLDRALLKRRDYDEKRRLPRLVFLEKGITGENTHIHFLIKGTKLKQYKHIKWTAECIWPTLTNAHDIVMKDATTSNVDRAIYCWKEFYIRESDTLIEGCCHLSRPLYT